jgi:hypothetical protein
MVESVGQIATQSRRRLFGRADKSIAGSSTAAAGRDDGASQGPADVDVWSQTSRKYLLRIYLLLGINWLLFCGLCMFTHWLHVARFVDFSWDSYVAPARLWGGATQTLNDFVLRPISVEQAPMHGVVLGLLVASIVAVPISVSLLFRFRYALPFVLAVVVFAHMPWMGLTLTIACFLASARPFRMSFRFGSALLALAPVLLYLLLATRGSRVAEDVGVSPAARLWLAGPWVLAILAACLMFAVILTVARFVRYQPTVVAAVLAVMFATPAILFHNFVGADELKYRLLESQYGPASRMFEPVRDATPQIHDLVRRWFDDSGDDVQQDQTLLAIWGERPRELARQKQRIYRHIHLELLEHRREAVSACRDFLVDHPGSRYTANVLYVQGRILDTRLDERKLLSDKVVRELYQDFPHVQSRPVWEMLATRYTDSPLSIHAGVRLAALMLRSGEVDAATAALREALARGDALDASPQTRPAIRQLWQKTPPESSLRYDPRPDCALAAQMLFLIEQNASDSVYGSAPLVEFALLDSHRRGYGQQLERIIRQYPAAKITDNVALQLAAAGPERDEHARQLLRLIEQHVDGDAAPEAIMRLTEIELQSAQPTAAAAQARAMERLNEVIRRWPQTIWAKAAKDRLRLLEASASGSVLTPRP